MDNKQVINTNTYKLYEQQQKVFYHQRDVTRDWQPKVEINGEFVEGTIVAPLFGGNPVQGRSALTRRNLERLAKKVNVRL